MLKYVALVVGALAAVSTTSTDAALVLLHDQEDVLSSPVNVAAGEGCNRAEIDAVCAGSPDSRSDLLFSGVVNKLSCLAENKARLSEACFFGEMDSTLDFIVEKQGNKCKDELRSKCGKQIDALKKAIQNTEVIGTIKGAVDVAQCIVSHAEDLWDHCKPQKQNKPEVQELTLLDNCDTRAFALCPPTQHKVLGFGFTLGCLADKAGELGMDCIKEQIVVAIEEMEKSDDKKCHEELRSKCGKQIDALKKAIQDTSILGVVKGAVDVVQCVAQNAEDLWHHCTPFQDQQIDLEFALEEEELNVDVSMTAGAPTPPTRKPTHKPTHKPTKAPTRKPTPKPTEKTQKPTPKPTGTARPTPKKISDAITGDVTSMMMMAEENDGYAMDEGGDIEDLEGNRRHHRHHHRHHHGHGGMEGADINVVVTEATVDYDMDLCVKSARKYCEKEVIAFNDSPFDVRALQTLNYCIEANAANIEAECAVASSTSTGYFASFFGNFHPRPVHAPCRHAGDEISNLPLCKSTHRCGGKYAFWIGLVIAVFLILSIKLTMVAYRRRAACCQKSSTQPQQRTVDGMSYEPLKDDVRAVPASNMV